MFRVQTLNQIAEKGLQVFTEERYEVGDRINHPDGILLRSYSLHQEEFSKDLKAIARAGAGVNNIPVERCTEKGIVVFNTPGANANAVKELIIASLIMSSRNIINGVSWTKNLEGEEVPQLVESGKQFVGSEIAGKRLGVIGLGAIGALVANDALALGMDVIDMTLIFQLKQLGVFLHMCKEHLALMKFLQRVIILPFIFLLQIKRRELLGNTL